MPIVAANETSLEQAAEIVRHGGLVAFPTETVYGLGADALNATAVASIFAAKGRPAHDPLIVHVADPSALPSLARDVPDFLHTLATLWPGPLTVVVPKADAVPDLVTAGRDTVAIRIPNHPVALALLRKAGVPIAAPSANRFGHTSPTTAQHVLDDLGARVDLILDGGPTSVGIESTVLDVTTTPPTLLRPGSITWETLRSLLGPVVLAAAQSQDVALPSPGMLDRHYAPNADLWLVLGSADACRQWMIDKTREIQGLGGRVGLLIADEDQPFLNNLDADLYVLGPEADWPRIASRLYTGLRQLDSPGRNVLLARDFGNTGLALALRDRLKRAAHGRVVDLSSAL